MPTFHCKLFAGFDDAHECGKAYMKTYPGKVASYETTHETDEGLTLRIGSEGDKGVAEALVADGFQPCSEYPDR